MLDFDGRKEKKKGNERAGECMRARWGRVNTIVIITQSSSSVLHTVRKRELLIREWL